MPFTDEELNAKEQRGLKDLKVYPEEAAKLKDMALTLGSSFVPTDPYGTYKAYEEGGVKEAGKHLATSLLLQALGLGAAKVGSKVVNAYKGAKAAKTVAAEALAAEAKPVGNIIKEELEDPNNYNVPAFMRDKSEKAKRAMEEAIRIRGGGEEGKQVLNREVNELVKNPKEDMIKWTKEEMADIEAGRKLNQAQQFSKVKSKVKETEGLIRKLEAERDRVIREDPIDGVLKGLHYDNEIKSLQQQHKSLRNTLSELSGQVGEASIIPPMVANPEDVREKYNEEGTVGAAKEAGKEMLASAALLKLAKLSPTFAKHLKGKETPELEKMFDELMLKHRDKTMTPVEKAKWSQIGDELTSRWTPEQWEEFRRDAAKFDDKIREMQKKK